MTRSTLRAFGLPPRSAPHSPTAGTQGAGAGLWPQPLVWSCSGGVALAGVLLTATRGLRQDMARLESRLDERMNGLESRLDGSIKALESRFDGLERQFGELRERMAHLEGLLEGLREAITVRASAS